MTDRQRKFVKEYLVDLNATQAAIRAHYSTATAGSVGCELLKNPNVRAHIDKEIAIQSRRTGVTADRVIRELAKVAFANSKDFINFNTATVKDTASDEDTAAIMSVRTKTTKDGIEHEIRMHDKLKALEDLGRHLGMFTDNFNIKSNEVVKIVDDIPDEDAKTK